MGIFEFERDSALDTLDHETEYCLLGELHDAELDVEDLRLRVINGTALISGIAKKAKDAEIARLMVGNHPCIGRVNDDGLIVAGILPAAKMITVREGDTLAKIAKDQLGSATRAREILEANQPMLQSEDGIFPGQVLRIPVDGMSMAH